MNGEQEQHGASRTARLPNQGGEVNCPHSAGLLQCNSPQALPFSPPFLGEGGGVGSRPQFSRMATADRSKLRVYMCRPGAPPASSCLAIMVEREMP